MPCPKGPAYGNALQDDGVEIPADADLRAVVGGRGGVHCDAFSGAGGDRLCRVVDFDLVRAERHGGDAAFAGQLNFFLLRTALGHGVTLSLLYSE